MRVMEMFIGFIMFIFFLLLALSFDHVISRVCLLVS